MHYRILLWNLNFRLMVMKDLIIKAFIAIFGYCIVHYNIPCHPLPPEVLLLTYQTVVKERSGGH